MEISFTTPAVHVGGMLVFPVEAYVDPPKNIAGGEQIYTKGTSTPTVFLQGSPD